MWMNVEVVSRTYEPQASVNYKGRGLITNNCGIKYKTMFNLKIIIQLKKKMSSKKNDLRIISIAFSSCWSR